MYICINDIKYFIITIEFIFVTFFFCFVNHKVHIFVRTSKSSAFVSKNFFHTSSFLVAFSKVASFDCL